MWWLLFIIVFSSVVLVKRKLSKRVQPPRVPQLLEAPKLLEAPQEGPEPVLHAAGLQAEDYNTASLPPLVSYYHWEPAILRWGLSDRIRWRLRRPSQARYGNMLRWYALGIAILLVGVGLWLWIRS
ncbi:hypothetical protein [Candidatus Entotheonella palauensis]|uniref:Uncharacterized protein n=1 Tax=Candidatus Entotheonella gemina TaxID=1429439 RepID=W4M244_9BACT|nr:hypothetical protein [Candidatus Entotheonella palauensis]ETX04399.1 MAG: hypothetical protein ETSY2_29040 [Candidatus Entotheonella gemina]